MAVTSTAMTTPKLQRWILRLQHRIPQHRDFLIAGRGLLYVSDRREVIMEPLHRHLLGGQHVVDLAAGCLRLDRLVVVEGMPPRMAREQERRMGYVRLDIDLGGAR